jgi:RNA-directed DNA polymerase
MRISDRILDSIDFTAHAEAVAGGRYERFPPLVMDRCLADCTVRLVDHLRSVSAAGYPVTSEVLTMPRRGFGPRPISMTTPTVRTLYRALVGSLSADLPLDSRLQEKWEAHNEFGVPVARPLDVTYLVNVDIASCYEYVEHSRLSHELIMKTSKTDEAHAIVSVLSEVTGRSRGLPQLLSASDALADIYLQVIERHMFRLGHRQSRMVDDFKFIADDWGEANQAIEDAAECARELGLVLSTEKTNVRRSDTVHKQFEQASEFLDEHFKSARESMARIFDFWNSYSDPAEEEAVSPQHEGIIKDALYLILHEWADGLGPGSPEKHLHAKYLGPALGWLVDYQERLSDKLLTEIVFHHPLKLEGVCRYLVRRRDDVSNWNSLKALTSMPRQSPWAKLWMLRVADQLPCGNGSQRAVLDWAVNQLDDKHEIVRSEAAWLLAGTSTINADRLAELYSRASSLTRPALAASCGRLGLQKSAGVVRALLQDTKLTKPAYEWGQRSRD